jgi:hypothetical protein
MLLAVFCALAGGAIAAGGTSALLAVSIVTIHVTIHAVPIILIAVGALALIRVLAPPGAWLGPLLLIAAGTVWLAFQTDRISTHGLEYLLAPTLIWGGILMAMMPADPRPGNGAADPDKPVRRVNAIIWSRRPKLGQRLPAQLTARAVLGMLTIDLTGKDPPLMTPHQIEINLSIFAGRIELHVPDGWSVQIGRVEAIRGISFDGKADPPLEPGDKDKVRHMNVHVLGLGGAVRIIRAA